MGSSRPASCAATAGLSPPAGLEAGRPPAPRVEGRLELVFAARGARTVLAHAYTRAPLKIVRPFQLDAGRLLVQVINVGPGVLAGDAYSVQVAVEPGARAVVIAQSATKLHQMSDGRSARQEVVLTVGDGGHLEYYPGLTIPFPSSDFAQDVTARLGGGARFGLLEQWAMGRIGRGESLRFRRLASRTAVYVEGVPAYLDALDLVPRAVDVGGWGILEGRRYLASGYWYGATAADRESAFGRLSAEATDLLVAFGESAPGQVYLRALAGDGCELRQTVLDALRAVSTRWHVEPIPLQRFTS